MTEETRSTLQEMSHTNPHTEDAFGDAMVFCRGLVAADGGETPREGTSGRSERQEARRLADVDHTPPYGEGVNRVYERGTEGWDDRV